MIPDVFYYMYVHLTCEYAGLCMFQCPPWTAWSLVWKWLPNNKGMQLCDIWLHSLSKSPFIRLFFFFFNEQVPLYRASFLCNLMWRHRFPSIFTFCPPQNGLSHYWGHMLPDSRFVLPGSGVAAVRRGGGDKSGPTWRIPRCKQTTLFLKQAIHVAPCSSAWW